MVSFYLLQPRQSWCKHVAVLQFSDAFLNYAWVGIVFQDSVLRFSHDLFHGKVTFPPLPFEYGHICYLSCWLRCDAATLLLLAALIIALLLMASQAIQL